MCDTVATPGGEAIVEIVSGDLDCEAAEDLLDTYHNDPPVVPEGSGAYVVIDEWECITATVASGGGSACRTSDGDEVVTRPGEGGDAAGNGNDEPVAEDGDGDPIVDDFCSRIDDYTLEMMFPDGELDEQICANYIGGEVSVDLDDG